MRNPKEPWSMHFNGMAERGEVDPSLVGLLQSEKAYFYRLAVDEAPA